MTFNVEYGGTGVDFAKIIEALEVAGPDVVGLEEPEGNAAAIAAALGWKHADPRTDVISRYPIIDPPGGDGRLVLLEVRPGEAVALANVHLPSDPYGPSLVAQGEPLEAVLPRELRVRVPRIRPFLSALGAWKGFPAFLVGDFNAPSRADWTSANVGQRAHLRYAVEWAVSVAVEQAGFVDSYRAVHPDSLKSPGLTWWAARLPVWEDFSRDPQDRIDFVYAAGPAKVLRSELVGEIDAPGVDLSVTPWPSDHRGVVSTFQVTPAPMPALVAVNGPRLVNVGDPLPVEFHNPGGIGRRIAIAPADPPGERLREERIAVAAPAAAGRGAVPLPTRDLSPGRYEVVLLSPKGEVVSRIPFAVKAPGDATQVTLDRAVYEVGQAIAVHWRNGPGNRWDWIGIFPGSVEPSTENYLLWQHTGTAIEGWVAIDASSPGRRRWPLPPAEYQALYLLHDAIQPVAGARFSVRGHARRRAASPRARGGEEEPE
jgi:endonuclease/exonuclease/phosphatase family metal-dependent hydrolase